MATDRDVAAYEPKQCEKCEGHGAIEGRYCNCSIGQMAVRDAMNRGDHVAVAFNHETGKKDVFVDRKHKPKIERAEPSRGAPGAREEALKREWFTKGLTEARRQLNELRAGIPTVLRATGRTIPDLTKREHVCEYQQSVKPRESGHVVLLEALRRAIELIEPLIETDNEMAPEWDAEAKVFVTEARAAIQQAERT